MKKISLVLGSLFFATLSITSCKSDDSTTITKTEEKPTLVGSWYLYASGDELVDQCGNKNTFTFNENNTGKGEVYYFDFEENECKLGTEGTFEYNFDGTTLNFIYGNTSSPAKITEFTNDKFTMVQTYETIGEIVSTYKKKN